MTLEQALQNYLTDQIDAPVYPLVFPDSVDFTTGAVRLQRLGGKPMVDHDGDTGTETARFQLSAFATTYAAVKTIAGQIKTALSGYAGPMEDIEDVVVFVTNEVDLYDPEMRIRHTAIDIEMTGAPTIETP